MIAAVRISRSMGRMAAEEAERVESVIRAIGPLPALAGFKLASVMDALHHDKKVRDGAIHFILPLAIGRVEITPDVPLQLVRDTVKALLHENKARP
jgi:3-dehydroquinate synthase